MPPPRKRETRTAVLLGASGATGQRLLPRLLDDASYDKVVTLSRRALDTAHPKLENRVVDFDRLAAGFEGLRVDDCYCTFGTTIRIAGSQAAMTRIDHDFVIDFARAGLAAGATRFAYLSAANADPRSPAFYFRLKGGTEEALKTLGFADLGIYRPGMIVAERTDRRLSESLLAPALPLLDKLMVGGLEKFKSIPVDTLAAALAAFATQQGYGTRIHHWREIVAASD